MSMIRSTIASVVFLTGTGTSCLSPAFATDVVLPVGGDLESAGRAASVGPSVREAASTRHWRFADEPLRLQIGTPLRLDGHLDDSDAQLDDGSRADIHVFSCDAGAIEITLTSSHFDTYLMIRTVDDDGVELWRVEDDDGAGGTDSRVRRVLEGPTTFAVVANSIDATGRGPYVLRAVVRSPEQAAIDDAAMQEARDAEDQALTLFDDGRLAEIEPLLRRVLETRRRVLGDEHPDTLTAINNLGFALSAMGRAAEAEPYYREALETGRRVEGNEHPNTLTALANYGSVLDALGRSPEAEPYYREALDTRRRLLGDDHPETLTAMNNYGVSLNALGRATEALPYLREVMDARRRILGDEDPSTLTSINNYASVLNAVGRAGEAEPYYRESLDLSRRVRGEDHPDTVTAASNYGFILHAIGRSDEAEPYFRESLDRRRRLLGDEHPDTVTSLNNYGSVLEALGRPADAEPYYGEALDISRRTQGDEHPATLTAISNYGGVLDALGRSAEAEPYLLEALDIRRRVLGEIHPDTIMSIGNYGSILNSVGRAADAEPYYRRAMELSRQVLGDEHPKTLTTISNYGFVLDELGRSAEAEALYRTALTGRRRVLGEDHPDTIASLNNYGGVLERLGRAVEAEPYYGEAMNQRRRVLGEEHPDTLTSLNNYGAVLNSLGRAAEAEAYYRESLERRRQVLGADHPDTLTSINNYGSILTALGRASEAEPYYRDAMVSRRRVLGDEHPDTLRSLNNYGFVLDALGRAAEAEPYYRESLEASRRRLGDDHPDTLTSINNYGSVLDSIGRPADAEPYYREALASYRRVRGDEHPDTLMVINNYGAVLEAIGRSAEAEPYLREAMEAYGRVLGDEHPDALTAVNNYGSWLETAGRPIEAEALYRRALDARRRTLGDEHPDTLSSIDNYGYVMDTLGRPADAERFFREALDARRRVLGNAHPLTLRSIRNIALLLEATERSREALPLWREYLPAVEARREGAAGDERGRSAVAEQFGIQTATLRMARLAIMLDGDGTAAFDLVERGRGRTILDLIARSENSMVRILRRQAPAAVVTYRAAIAAEAAARNRVRQLEAQADLAGRRGADAERDRLDEEAIGARAALGRATFAVFNVMREHVRTTAPTPAAAAQAFLEPGTVLLSIGLQGDLGVVVGLSQDAVVGTTIADAAGLRRQLHALRTDVTGRSASVKPTALALMADSMLDDDELRTMVDGATRVVVLPSPEVAGIPFELLLPEVQITYASSASVYFDRLDAADEIVVARGAPLVAVGNPDFSGLSGAMPGDDAPASPRAVAQAETLRAASRSQLRTFGGSLAPLPGTQAEIRTIEAVAEAAGTQVDELLGRDATVPAVRELVERTEPRYLHLATHGFPGTAERPYTASLALTTPVTPTPDDTGFLTLDDLIQGWFGLLDETDLVVLSACDTGVGVARGDSDMALPWGFYFAGTPTVICSLWPVDDAATALLMGRLYENLLGRTVEARTVWNRTYDAGTTIPKADALDEAKAWLRGLNREQARTALDAIGLTERSIPRGFEPDGPAASDDDSDAATPYAHPQYWAAFVLRGSPR